MTASVSLSDSPSSRVAPSIFGTCCRTHCNPARLRTTRSKCSTRSWQNLHAVAMRVDGDDFCQLVIRKALKRSVVLPLWLRVE
eukprot:1538442-Alexandrium_andersonii.AAC.1